MEISQENRAQQSIKNAARKVLLFLAFITISTSFTYAQTDNGFGIKAGLNYNANGDYFDAIEVNSKNPDRNVGYHIGVFGKIGNELYLKPELVYTSTKSNYDNDEFDMKKLDLPVLVGLKVIGPLSVFAGPSFQYILDSDFDNIDVDNVQKDFSAGLNFGIGLNFKKLGIDLRYERGFSKNEANFLQNNNITTTPDRLDTRPDQLILSLSLVL